MMNAFATCSMKKDYAGADGVFYTYEDGYLLDVQTETAQSMMKVLWTIMAKYQKRSSMVMM